MISYFNSKTPKAKSKKKIETKNKKREKINNNIPDNKNNVL